MSKPTAEVSVYWIYGEGMTPLYVGIAADVDQRLRQHSEKAWWCDVRRIDAKPYSNRARAAEVERSEIRRLAPRWNSVHNDPARQPRRAPIPRVNSGGRRQLVTIQEAADYAACNPRTIRRRISDGSLTGYRFGGRLIRVDLTEVDTLLRPIPSVRSFT